MIPTCDQSKPDAVLDGANCCMFKILVRRRGREVKPFAEDAETIVTMFPIMNHDGLWSLVCPIIGRFTRV